MLKAKGKVLTEVVVFTDGASRGNPGPAASGAVLYSGSGEKVSEVSRYIGQATNNVAEYLGVIYGLQEAAFLGVKNVRLKTDSQLISRQLNGKYKVKDAGMKIFFDIAKNIFRYFESIVIEEIPREENREADLMANRALDEKALL
jgi:ribonuclease HI